MTDRPAARYVRPGEMLAIDPSKLHAGPGAFFWLFGGGTPANERRGDIAIVHVRGAMDHHDEGWGENYEAIVRRVESAMTGQDAVDAHERSHRYDDGYEAIEAVKPSTVILAIDSPGGSVAGLFDTVRALVAMKKKHGVKLIACADEMIASAAFALTCACDETFAPTSAIVGSIGVISTMVSQDAKNKGDGIDVRLITSGARKADGHPHAPISSTALSTEQDRVNKLAAEFFKLASKARDLSVGAIQKLEAGIFLGRDARKRRLTDGIMSLDTLVATLSQAAPAKAAGKPTGGETVPAAKIPLDSGTASRSPSIVPRTNNVHLESAMPVKLDALIIKTRSAIATEDDPVKLAELTNNLGAYLKAAKDCDDEEEEDDDEEDESKKSKKTKKAAAPKGETEDDDEAKKAAAAPGVAPAATLSSLLGLSGAALEGRLTALIEKAEAYDALANDVAQMKADTVKSKRNALIDEAVAQRRITRKQAEGPGSKKLAYVEQFLEMHPTALVNIDEDALAVPDGTPAADIPANVKRIVEQAITAQGLDGEKAEAFRATAYADQRKSVSRTEVH